MQVKMLIVVESGNSFLFLCIFSMKQKPQSSGERCFIPKQLLNLCLTASWSFHETKICMRLYHQETLPEQLEDQQIGPHNDSLLKRFSPGLHLHHGLQSSPDPDLFRTSYLLLCPLPPGWPL